MQARPSERPELAVPTRPVKPLSPLDFLRTAGSDTVSIFDEALFDELVVVRRYGPVPVAFVSDPAGVRHVLVDRFDKYPRIPAVRRLYAAEIGTGTLASSGAIWRRHRRISGPAMDRRAISPDVAGLTASAEALAGSLSLRPDPRLEIGATVSAIWAALLNEMATSGDPRGPAILAWLSKVPRKPKPLDLMPMPEWLKDRVSAARQSPERVELRAELRRLIEERLEPGYAGRPDLLWRLAHAADRESGESLPLDEMRDEAASVLAGGDAAVRALTWIWYLLALHPEVEARVHAELDAVVGDEPLTAQHLPRLTYVRQVLDETMRLYPPIPIAPRQASQADVVCGRRIPKGAVVIVSPWVVHRHRRLWDDPDSFDPDRFSDARRLGRPPLSFIPFIAGPGTCVGAYYAVTQMLIIVAALARRYRFALAPDRPVMPFGGISLHPRGGLWATVESRRAAA